MPKRIHPLTTLSVILVLLAPLLIAVDEAFYGMAIIALAYTAALLEFKKYTSDFQFVMILIAGAGLGLTLDQVHGVGPVFALSLSLAASATVVRQAFMHRFTYVSLLWLDTGMALIALTLYLLVVWNAPFAWDLWIFPLLPIGFAVGLTLSYVQDAARMRVRTQGGYRVQVGHMAPQFELRDQVGESVRLSDYRGKHPVLLIFVRGDWCPGCHMMLRTYERHRARFLEKGIHVLGIGPDDISVNQSMVERIGVGYRMLSDDDQSISTRYGVVYSNPVIELGVDYTAGIPLPASFLVDQEGIVRYVSRPDRVGEFLDPSLIFGVLETIQPQANVAWN
ncbi:MAG: peroxiredoxin family protein [Flavobacteriales bacterium]